MRKILAPILVILFVSCQKNDTPLNDSGPDDATRTVYINILNEYVLANEIFQDVVNNSGDVLLIAENSLTGKTNSSKIDATITIEPFDLETFPKTITVDFGSGTQGRDGVIRRGSITIVSTGWYWEQESLHTITFNNYYHEVFKVGGTQVVKNFGENEDGLIEFFVTVEDGIISSTDGVNVTFNDASSRIWIAGSETPLNIWDDEYLLDALQNGFSSDGTTYTLVFEEPLHYVLLPRAIRSGIIDLNIGGYPGFKINYNNKTITILGVTTGF
ncbi:hypothetical protein [Seonamhaeicola aphaedonensis]|uniref:Uncharacterized protein n=1 Tax=Seonamhaeicola aphaedonensis TaxID=1461338 RepID=A0A3D9H8P5_9FLAO|nr:hypothetical protein [Seonamhaeicola aphaedonensis]RED45870.1 hypothetical protein DFQ02_10715 [Seonamhaeicola aphaedonensis]